ncbi:MAG: VacJ family lipoprotein [Myxococcota bacterium]|nr:VacJ family lipoprotein [Myxococcota bacterium]
MFRSFSGRNPPPARSYAGVPGLVALAFLLLAGSAWGAQASSPPAEANSAPGDSAASSANEAPVWTSDEFEDFDDFDFELDEPEISDPMEPVNRQMLKLNRVLDRFVLDPITVGYRFLVPQPGRRAVYRFFTNINSTQSLANDIFQLEWKDAQRTFVRLVINSTAGIGGLFDPATAWGLDGHVSDFGQTLALAGVSTGPYVVLPLFGPSDARDAVGLGVDSLFHPTFFILPGVDALFFNTSSGFSERESHYEELKALEESSIDYYSALRSGFIQSREAQVWSRREDRRPPGVQ